jgi:F-box/TPR repeat protein Pof3
MIEPPQLPSTLEHFTWEPRRTVSAEASWGETYYSCVSSLTHLSVTNIERLSADWLSRVIDHWVPTKGEDDQVLEPDARFQAIKDATPLRYLSIKGTLRDDVTSLFAESKNTTFRDPSSLFGRSPRILTPALKHLAIADLPCDDNEIEHLVSHNLRLESIDLSASNITGAGIKMLADGIPTLKHIRADNSSRINGRDAIAYAERKGIVVSCSMGEGKSGKRIRYL